MLTKQNFKALAWIIARQRKKCANTSERWKMLDSMMEDIATHCRDSNPAFDRDKFYRACEYRLAPPAPAPATFAWTSPQPDMRECRVADRLAALLNRQPDGWFAMIYAPDGQSKGLALIGGSKLTESLARGEVELALRDIGWKGVQFSETI